MRMRQRQPTWKCSSKITCMNLKLVIVCFKEKFILRKQVGLYYEGYVEDIIII